MVSGTVIGCTRRVDDLTDPYLASAYLSATATRNEMPAFGARLSWLRSVVRARHSVLLGTWAVDSVGGIAEPVYYPVRPAAPISIACLGIIQREVDECPSFSSLAVTRQTHRVGMVESPPDRPAAASELAEALGGQTECFYYAFGEFDIVTIMELPDDAAAGRVLSLAVTSSGRVKSLRTHRLISAEEAPDMFSKAQAAVAVYKVPGG